MSKDSGWLITTAPQMKKDKKPGIAVDAKLTEIFLYEKEKQ